jgi:hypothetical protein
MRPLFCILIVGNLAILALQYILGMFFVFPMVPLRGYMLYQMQISVDILSSRGYFDVRWVWGGLL